MRIQRSCRPALRAWSAGLVVCLLAVASSVAWARQGAPSGSGGAERWWKREPIRFLQTNLSETDSALDPRALVAAVDDFGANTFLMNMGGIVAQYPTKVPFHYPSAFLPAADADYRAFMAELDVSL